MKHYVFGGAVPFEENVASHYNLRGAKMVAMQIVVMYLAYPVALWVYGIGTTQPR